MDVNKTGTPHLSAPSPSLDSQFWHRPDRSQVEVPAGRREEATAGPKPVPGIFRWEYAEVVQ